MISRSGQALSSRRSASSPSRAVVTSKPSQPELLGERDEQVAVVVHEQDPWGRGAVAARRRAAEHGREYRRRGQRRPASGVTADQV